MIAEKNYAARQSRGARALQEDAYAFSKLPDGSGKENGLLIVVADGMGGHAAGERASALASKSFVEGFHRAAGNPEKRLASGLTAANQAIEEEMKRESAMQGMGTTLVAVSVTPAGIEWVSVGDSPLYLYHKGALKRMNADHSLRPVLSEMAKRRDTSTTPGHTSGSLLRAALMGEEIALTDQSSGPLPLQDGDLIVVATDGIHTLNDRQIATICTNALGEEARGVATKLLHAVLAVGNPHQDNTTIAVVKMGSGDNDFMMPL
jgi:protein phosphatase